MKYIVLILTAYLLCYQLRLGVNERRELWEVPVSYDNKDRFESKNQTRRVGEGKEKLWKLQGREEGEQKSKAEQEDERKI